MRSLFVPQIPASFESEMAQREFVVKATLISAAYPLVGIFSLLAVLGIIGVETGVNWFDVFIMVGIVGSGLGLVRLGRVTLARYLVVGALFSFSLLSTFRVGLSSVSVLGYVVTMLMAYMMLSRKVWVVGMIILLPVIVDGLLMQGWGVNSRTLWAYLSLMTVIGFLLSFYTRLLERAGQDLQEVSTRQAVQEAGFSIMSSLDLQDTIAKILEELKNIVPHDSASVLLLREDDHLEIVGGSGWEHPEDVIGIRFPVPGSNPNSVVIQKARPHLLNNAPEAYPSFREAPHSHIKSWLGVPLSQSGKVIGMLAIDSNNPGNFTEDHVHIAVSFADHVAIAIENALLFDILNQAVNRRSVLYRASQEVIRAGADLERIYVSIHDAACELMSCEAFVITLLDEEEKFINGAYLIDRGGRSEQINIPLGEGMSGKVIETGLPVLVQDLMGESNFQGEHFGHADDVRSLVAVPFSIGDKVIGMLSAQSYKPAQYGPEELELLELLAAQAGVAIENARLLAKMEHMANTDGLTGLRNRRAYDQILEDELTRARRYGYPLSLVIMDIDDFKQFNDRYGHSKGDEHLAEISRLTRSSVRDQDVVARVGGEEFGVILPHTSREGAKEFAERIRRSIEEAFKDKFDVGKTVSLGVAEYPLDASTLQDLYEAADQAMFAVKNSGKNRVGVPSKSDQRRL